MTNVLEKLLFLLHCAVNLNILYLKGLSFGLVDLNTWSPKSLTNKIIKLMKTLKSLGVGG